MPGYRYESFPKFSAVGADQSSASIGSKLVTETRGPGRPLDRTRDDAILSATLELFGEVGWDKLTIAEVARRAKVGLSTIYRRWDSKAELVAAAIATTLPSGSSQPGAPEPDPSAILEAIRSNLTGERAPYFPGLIAAMRTDPAMADAIRTAAIDPDRDRLRQHVAERLGTDADPELVDLVADIGPAILVHRAIVIGEPPPSAATQQLTDLIERIIRALQQE